MCKEVMIKELVKAEEIQKKYSNIVYRMQCELLKKNKNYDKIDELMGLANDVKHEFEEQFEIYRSVKKQYYAERKAV
jgi:hypothetical protein